MHLIRLEGISNGEIDFEHIENSLYIHQLYSKEIHIKCLVKPLNKLRIKVQTSNKEVFQVVGKPIEFTDKYQVQTLKIKAKFPRKQEHERDRIKIIAHESYDSMPQSQTGPIDNLQPPEPQEILLYVNVKEKPTKTFRSSAEQRQIESKILMTQYKVSDINQEEHELIKKKSEFLYSYQQRSQINSSAIATETSSKVKQDYEELLILTDEQEKELFKLSELKNRLQRQKMKQQHIVETPKQLKLNTVHLGYAIIIVIVSFMIGMLTKT